MFFPFSSVSNQTYLLRKNRYQLTVFDRLNSYKNKMNFYVHLPKAGWIEVKYLLLHSLIKIIFYLMNAVFSNLRVHICSFSIIT
jgi:hypothetical protein